MMQPAGVRVVVVVVEEVALPEEPQPSAAAVVYLLRQKELSFSPKSGCRRFQPEELFCNRDQKDEERPVRTGCPSANQRTLSNSFSLATVILIIDR